MLDSNILEQLKTHFQDLGASISFALYKSDHEKQGEIETMLDQISSVSNEIELKRLDDAVEGIQFDILRNDEPTGIRFRGVPGGHEFTSLILAILNAAGKGRLPDQGVQNRIAAINGPIKVTTYVSLSCENCPDIVQALNVMSLFNSGIEHEMVDGGLYPDEVKKLNLGGVPAVIIDGELIHSGKGTLGQLVEKLETKFGSDKESVPAQDLGHYDVAVIGGGPAGASAAIYSARKGLKTVVIADKMGGQVQETKGIENMVSVVYTEGPQLAASLEKHMREYPIEILEHRRVEQIDIENGRMLQLSSRETLRADSIIVATGAKWRELNIPGEKDYLGRGVAYCPHCDGPYYKNKKVAVIGGGNSGVEAAIDLAGICSEVVLFEFMDQLKADDVLVKKLHSLSNVTVHTSARTDQVLGDGKNVTGLSYEDRESGAMKEEKLDGVFVQIGLIPNSKIGLDQMETNQFGEIIVDGKGRTNVPGVYAAGDVTTTPYKQIIISMGEGAKAALSAFEDRMKA
ncbi:alkyl hydroperoxide reductase subunit F [Pseudobacteriovorax antillogorgiicola]|uniref:Alkyl hydroperoxide reductase subunit F n=1 Tax=Pseudobacteriovorax antillogorgiicola TaxID=1513793 RepID=A0A1Y6BR89_9BACT|nr:alkyl hydroperoxide reductase subunit F [Pseudobacteriovorax antillogorgiicola]TCS54660.1 alkyl hydroperoxide reductase subunit F [Pseudobacteriovorax antillogorgiicola]SMF16817.1 alkyl hydroperoxide reductase subunit F [Pseudobacteriovorax antillogorgiicola]